MRIDKLHDAAVLATTLAGAKPCEELLLHSSGERMADSVFLTHELIVEVKSLTTDRKNEDESRRKYTKIINKWAERGVTERRDKAWRAKLGDFPKPVQHELLNYMGNRVRKVLASSNRQISATSRRLGLPTPIGLVILVTPKHFSLDTNALTIISQQEMLQSSLSAINAVLIFEAPSAGYLPGPLDLMAQPVSIPGRLLPSKDVMEAIVLSWYWIIEQVTGIDTTVILPPQRPKT